MTKETTQQITTVPAVQQESQLDMILRTHQLDKGLLENMSACAETGIALAKKGAMSITEEFAMVCAQDDLKGMMMQSQRLTDMAMKMQNNPMYFKTDNAQGYPLATVVDCMIQARLMGLGWRGNQFNILQGRLYVTKEGADSLLTKMGVPHTVVVGTFTYGPMIKGGIDRNGRQMADVVTVDVPLTVYWEEDGKQCQKEMTFNLRMNANTTVDNVNGKAEAHALRWLYKFLASRRGMAGVSFGDAEDIQGAIAQASSATASQKAARQILPARPQAQGQPPAQASQQPPAQSQRARNAQRIQAALDSMGETVQAMDLMAWLTGRGTPVASDGDCTALLEALHPTLDAYRRELQSA